MKIRRSIMIMAALLAGIVPARGFAAEGPFRGEDPWNPPSPGPVVTWTAPVEKRGDLSVQPFVFYNRTRGIFDEEGHYKSYTDKDRKWQWQEALLLQYGLTDRLELAAYGTYQQNIVHQDGSSAEASGFNDTFLYARYLIADEKGWMPCVTAIAQGKIPTGKYQKFDDAKHSADYMGDPADGGLYDHGYGLIASKRLKPFIIHADCIYVIPVGRRIDGVKTRYGNYIIADLAVEYLLPRGFVIIVEGNAFVQGDTKAAGALVPASDSASLTFSPGIGWSNKDIQTLLAYQRTIAGKNIAVDDSLVATFVVRF